MTLTGAGATDGRRHRRPPAASPSPRAPIRRTPSPTPLHAAGQRGRGIAVRCAVTPRVGDRLRLDTALAPITGGRRRGRRHLRAAFANGTASPTTAQTRFGLFAVENATVVAARFTLTVASDGAVAETFAGLALSPDHPQYFAKDDVVNGVRVT